MQFSTILFFALAAFSLTPWSSAAMSLLLGLVFALTFGPRYPKQSKKISKYTLQAAVVGLGFGLDFMTVVRVGAQGFLLTLVTIALTLSIGILIGKWLNVERKSRTLIAVGTAICGGSAIAAVGPVIHADDEQMSVSLGTVFILNAIALFFFPAIGHMLDMSQGAFGLWSALAIHDTSSVVGAAASYGKQALEVGTTIKLTRALWIVPVALFFAYLEHKIMLRKTTGSKPASETSRPKIQIPWFIGLFVLASLIRSAIPGQSLGYDVILTIAKSLLSLTLFLIGAGLSRAALKHVGVRPLLNGVILWLIVGVSTLVAITAFSVR
jgi:uncharacterized integral membrane protein (TIGR00698 family)